MLNDEDKTIDGYGQLSRLDTKGAEIALRYIFMLAQIDHYGRATVGNMLLTEIEAGELIMNKKTLEQILETRERDRINPYAFLSEIFENTDRSVDTPSSFLPVAGEQVIRSVEEQIEYDLNLSTRRPSGFANLEDYDREKEAMFSFADLSRASSRLVWVMEARKRYEAGELTIKTADGRILPTWQEQAITGGNGDIVDKKRIDNTALSCDGKFYDTHGQHVYSEKKWDDSMFDLDRMPTEAFVFGTPGLEDVTEEKLLVCINEFMNTMKEKTPVLALILSAQASPLVAGLTMPEPDEDTLKKAFIKRNVAWGDDALAARVLEALKTGELSLGDEFSEKMDKFLTFLKTWHNQALEGGSTSGAIGPDENVPAPP